ncbi:helix-turn-helix domain-containing protein, partial [Acinetobacter baumannii]
MNRNQVHNILSPRGDLISLRRRMLGMNQTELSASSHISQAHISKIEQGIKEPNEEQLSKLANALKCPVSFFY